MPDSSVASQICARCRRSCLAYCCSRWCLCMLSVLLGQQCGPPYGTPAQLLVVLGARHVFEASTVW
jgi:hypothetical protein